MLKMVTFWTFLPLIFTPKETMIKHLLFLLDVLLTDYLLPHENTFEARKITHGKIKLFSFDELLVKVYAWILFLTKFGILLFQLVQVFVVQIYLSANEDLTYKVQVLLLPTIASLLNQFCFIEIIYSLTFS